MYDHTLCPVIPCQVQSSDEQRRYMFECLEETEHESGVPVLLGGWVFLGGVGDFWQCWKVPFLLDVRLPTNERRPKIAQVESLVYVAVCPPFSVICS